MILPLYSLLLAENLERKVDSQDVNMRLREAKITTHGEVQGFLEEVPKIREVEEVFEEWGMLLLGHSIALHC